VAQLDRLARRVYQIAGWHVELYVDARELPALESTLAASPQLASIIWDCRLKGSPTCFAWLKEE